MWLSVLRQAFSETMASSLASLLSDLKDEGLVLVLRNVEMVLRAFPVEGPHVFRDLLPSIFKGILDGEVNVWTVLSLDLWKEML